MASIQESRRLQKLLADSSSELVGAAVAVVSSDGNVEYATIGRPDVGKDNIVTIDTPFPLWSTSKLLTATLVGQLVDEGILSLNDPLTKWVPELAPAFQGATPTIRHLLSHSAGVVDLYEPIPDVDTLVKKVTEYGTLAQPGEILSYSNTAYVILGALLTNATGKSWPELIRLRIMEPLKLTKVQLGDEDPSTVPELARNHNFTWEGTAFVEELFERKYDLLAAAGSTAAAPIGEAAVFVGAVLLGTHANFLSPEIRREMQTLQSRMPGASQFCEGWGLGLSIVDDSLGLVGHMGATGAYIFGSAKYGKAFVFLSNTSAMLSPKRNGAIVGRGLAYKALGLEEPSESESRADATIPPGLSGKYASPLFAFDVSERDAKILATSTFTGELELEHVSGHEFKGMIGSLPSEFNFVGAQGGDPPRYLHVGLRAIARA